MIPRTWLQAGVLGAVFAAKSQAPQCGHHVSSRSTGSTVNGVSGRSNARLCWDGGDGLAATGRVWPRCDLV